MGEKEPNPLERETGSRVQTHNGFTVGIGHTSSVIRPIMAVICTATTQKRHWKMSSIVSEWKLKLLRATLFSSTMLADATQYAKPANICEREGVIVALVRAQL